ncbi:hypothetical protein Tco_0801283 [Tanacetum coccineum]|uniref:Uncharacterized protein n=1 Tax=Tanacetum coccineum TaxID=301880 RepID=A0ABQ4ZZG7_9ASTR
MKILSIIRLSVDNQFGYGYLKEIVVRRADQKEYVFKEADFPKLHLNDIEDMYIMYAQNKLHHLKGDEQTDLVTALRFFIRRIIFKKRVEDIQHRVEIYQTSLNITRPQVRYDDLDFKEPYTILHKPKDLVMSDSEDSTITYMEVSSPFEDLSDIGSPGVNGLPIMPKDPYAYVVATFQAPPSLDYFMPPEDEVFLAEEQLPVVEDPTDYPADWGDDDDDDDESSDDDEDDDDVEEDEDKEEEEEHPALVDSVPLPVHRVTARISVRAQTPISLPSDTEVARLLAIPTPPPSPLSPLAAMIRLRAETPSTSHPLPSSTPPSGTPPLLPIPLPTPSPPMLLPSIVCRAGVSEVTLLPWKRLCIALSPRYKVVESSSAPTARPTRGFRADYRFVGTLDNEIRRDPERGRDRLAHARTARLMETEARLSHEAWVHSMDASDTARYEVRALRTTMLAQHTEIIGLRTADRTRQAQLVETLTLMRTLQTHVTTLQS